MRNLYKLTRIIGIILPPTELPILEAFDEPQNLEIVPFTIPSSKGVHSMPWDDTRLPSISILVIGVAMLARMVWVTLKKMAVVIGWVLII